MLPALVVIFLCSQPSALEIEGMVDSGDDEALLGKLSAIKSANYSASERQEIARVLMRAARKEKLLSLSLEIGSLALSLDETLDGRLFLARQEVKVHEYGAAAQHLDRALTLDPENHEVLMERAHIAREMEDFIRAAAFYEKAATLGVTSAKKLARECRELDEQRFLQEVKDANPGLRSPRGAEKSMNSKTSSSTLGARHPAPSPKETPSQATNRDQRHSVRDSSASDRTSAAMPSGPVPEKRRLALREVTDVTFHQTVQTSALPVLVLFEAPWCHPCLELNNELARLQPRYSQRVNIVSLNVETAPKTRERQAIRSIPQLLLFSGKASPKALPTNVDMLKTELHQWFSTDEK